MLRNHLMMIQILSHAILVSSTLFIATIRSLARSPVRRLWSSSHASSSTFAYIVRCSAFEMMKHAFSYEFNYNLFLFYSCFMWRSSSFEHHHRWVERIVLYASMRALTCTRSHFNWINWTRRCNHSVDNFSTRNYLLGSVLVSVHPKPRNAPLNRTESFILEILHIFSVYEKTKSSVDSLYFTSHESQANCYCE